MCVVREKAFADARYQFRQKINKECFQYNKIMVCRLSQPYSPLKPSPFITAASFSTILTIFGFTKTDSNHFTRWFWSRCEAGRPNMFIKSNRCFQFNQGDVVIFLAIFILRMWNDGRDIDNLRIRPVIVNINYSEFNSDGFSALPVIFTMCSFW